ncbi:MAG: M48 family metalloprotease [Planctomycetes bacterium]|nr:M48 family metalloprotease [Planctomycetota bacterium]
MQYLQNSYSQKQELDADTLAVRLTNAAGFDPTAGSRLFNRLSDQNRPDTQNKLARYFSSHPPFDVRIQNIDSLCTSNSNPKK